MRLRRNGSPAWSAAIAAGGSPEKLIADFRKSIRNGWRCSRIDFLVYTIKSLHNRIDTTKFFILNGYRYCYQSFIRK